MEATIITGSQLLATEAPCTVTETGDILAIATLTPHEVKAMRRIGATLILVDGETIHEINTTLRSAESDGTGYTGAFEYTLMFEGETREEPVAEEETTQEEEPTEEKPKRTRRSKSTKTEDPEGEV